MRIANVSGRPIIVTDKGAIDVETAGRSADAIDATVVLLAVPGDRILTSDPGDITLLAAAAQNRAVVVAC
jgi:hypothetical protein